MNNRNRRFLFRSGGSYHLYLDTDFSGFVQPHSHAFYQILLVKSGHITQLQNGKKYNQQPGDIYFTPPGCEHSLYVFRNGTNYFCLSFSTEIAEAALTQYPELKADFSNFPSMLPAGEARMGALCALFDMLLPAGESIVRNAGGPGPFLAAAAVAVALGAAAEYVQEELPRAQSAPNADEAVRETLRYVDEHFYEELSVEGMAARAGLSKSCFCKKFAALAGMAPKRYLTEKRMHEALKLIHGSDLSLNRIAEEVGYQDFSTFYRGFTKMTGCSPSQYRATLPQIAKENEYHNYQF